LQIKYSRTGQEISLDKNTIEKEMVLFLLRGYLVNKDKSHRKIAQLLSLDEMEQVNILNWEGKNKNQYIKIYNSAITSIETTPLEEIIATHNIELSSSGKKALERLKNTKGNFTVKDLNSNLSLTLNNPDTSKEAKDEKRKGMPDKKFQEYSKYIGKKKGSSTEVNVLGPDKIQGKKGKVTIVELRSIRFKELDFNNPENPMPNSKIAYLKELGYAPISLMESRSVKRKGRGGIETTSIKDKKQDSYRGQEISGGSLTAENYNSGNQTSNIFETQFLNKTPNKEVLSAKFSGGLSLDATKMTGLTNSKLNDTISSYIMLYSNKLKVIDAELTVGEIQTADKFETQYNKEEQKIINQFFSPFGKPQNPKWRENKVTYKTKTGEKKTIEKPKGTRKKIVSRGEYILPNFNRINDLGIVDGKKVTLLNMVANTEMLKVVKRIKALSDSRKEGKAFYKTYIGEVKNLKSWMKSEIEKLKQWRKESVTDPMDEYVQSKLEDLKEKTNVTVTSTAFSNKDAKEAFKRKLKPYIKSTFSEALRDYGALYEIEIKIEKIITKYVEYKTGKKDKKGNEIMDKQKKKATTTYTFQSPSLVNATHRIETKAANIGLDTKDKQRSVYGQKYNSGDIKSVKSFIDSTKRAFKTLENSLA
jgi:hypothetical protein